MAVDNAFSPNSRHLFHRSWYRARPAPANLKHILQGICVGAVTFVTHFSRKVSVRCLWWLLAGWSGGVSSMTGIAYRLTPPKIEAPPHVARPVATAQTGSFASSAGPKRSAASTAGSNGGRRQSGG